MKTLIIFLLAFTVLAAKAQKWQPPVNTPVEVKFKVTISQMQDFLNYSENHALLDTSNRISAKQLSVLRSNYQFVINSLTQPLNILIEDSRKAFVSDSLKTGKKP